MNESESNPSLNRNCSLRVLMILENASLPEDSRVLMESQALHQAGHQVTVICPTGDRKSFSENIDGVRVYRYPCPKEFDGILGYLFEYTYSMAMAMAYSLFILSRHGFDVIHVHSPPDMNALIPIAYRILGKRFVLDTHDLSPELYDAQKQGEGNRTVVAALKWFERLACRWAHRLIATNESQREVQLSRGGGKREHAYVVRNGPSARFLAGAEPLPEFADDPRIKLGYVGMISEQDGVDCFIQAMAVLKKRRSDFLGIVVGSGPAVEELHRLTSELDLDDQVRFTGLVPYNDVPRYIASFDVCLTPDPRNAYNDSCTTIKTMEYMALAKPTVAFATPENQYTAGDAALYADDDNIESLVNQIERLMDDTLLRDTMGQSGLRRVKEQLAWVHQKAQLIALYDSLCPEPKTVPKTTPSI